MAAKSPRQKLEDKLKKMGVEIPTEATDEALEALLKEAEEKAKAEAAAAKEEVMVKENEKFVLLRAGEVDENKYLVRNKMGKLIGSGLSRLDGDKLLSDLLR